MLTEDAAEFGWEDIDEGPPESDASWAPFTPKDYADSGKTLSSYGGKKLSKEERQKLKDKEQLQQAVRPVLVLVHEPGVGPALPRPPRSRRIREGERL